MGARIFTKLEPLLFLCALSFAFCTGSCSVPNLEQPQCTAARDAVKRFYSLHFADDMRPSADAIKASQPYLTEDLSRALLTSADNPFDYFTQTDDYPRAFRIGSCTTNESNDKTELQVLLFWRDDNRTEQREVKVEAVKAGDRWLVNKVSK
jgi:Protein of unknown function (DUF3828)